MKVDAVGFDLDETLAGIERTRARVLADATDRADAPDISRAEYLAAHAEHSGGDTREPVFAALLADHETDTSPGTLTAAYRDAVRDALDPVEDVPRLVATLRNRYLVGLLTDGPVGTQRGKLERLDWTDLFDATVVTGALPAPKPDRRAFDAFAEALDVAPERVVYVGDHPENDIEGARDAGMIPVQVLYEGGPDPHPDAVATVDRERLVQDLPGLLDDLDG